MKKLLSTMELSSLKHCLCLCLLLVFWNDLKLSAQSRVLERHYKTIGEQQLQLLQTACIKGRFVPLTREPTTFVAYLKFPDKIKIDWTQGRTRWTDVYSGGKAYSRQGGITTELEGKESFDLLWMLRSTSPLRGAIEQAVKVSQEKWSSKDFYKLASGTSESQVEFLLDKSTYEIVLERIISTAKSGKSATQEIKYLRYMDLGGVKVPAVFVLETEEGSADLIYDEVLLGYPLNDGFFN